MASMNAFPSDPAGDLAAAELASRRLTGALKLPSWFHTSLGAAVAVHLGTAAYGLGELNEDGEPGGTAVAVLVAGCLVFAAVAAVQVLRFRRLNGVQVGGLVSRAVLGTSIWSSLAEAGGLAAAFGAVLADLPWLAALAAVAGGAAYAASGHLWWRGYLADPAGHARAESRTTLVAYGVVGVVALVLLVALR